MKITIMLCMAVLLHCHAFSQRYDANWVFGDSAGLHFNENGTVSPNTSAINSIESSSSISDSLGNLLFYTDGITIWNKEHTVMENGDSLFNNELSYIEKYKLHTG